MEAPPRPLAPMRAAARHEEEEETCFFLASLAAATSTSSDSSSSSSYSSRSMKAALSLLPASPDFMAFQGFVSLGVGASRKRKKGKQEGRGGWGG